MNDLIIKEVNFHNNKILAVLKNEKIYIAVKRICEIFKMTEGQIKNQRLKLQEDEFLKGGLIFVPLVTKGGIQETLVIELDYLPLWLAKINPARFDKKLKSLLFNYQLWAKDILADAFFGRREAFIVEEKTSLEKNVRAIQKLEKDAANILSTLKYLYAELEVTGKNNVESIDNLYLKTDGVSIFKSGINGGWSAIRSLEIKK